MAKRLRDNGATVYVVSVGKVVDNIEIEAMAGNMYDVGAKLVDTTGQLDLGYLGHDICNNSLATGS